jgi:hypothetical protein
MATRWRGDRWGEADNCLGGLRLLILGESHYHDTAPVGSDLPDMTNDVVNGYLEGNNSHAFFGKIERLVSGRDAPCDRGHFWHSVVFYNYIPVIVANAPRTAPAEAFWGGNAPELFKRLVKAVEAEAVLVCGTTLWRRMVPGMVERDAAYEAGGRSWREREYEVAMPYRAVAAHIPHPTGSWGWSFKRCEPVVRHLRTRVAEIRAETGAPALPAI